jgi:hypothetical protein
MVSCWVVVCAAVEQGGGAGTRSVRVDSEQVVGETKVVWWRQSVMVSCWVVVCAAVEQGGGAGTRSVRVDSEQVVGESVVLAPEQWLNSEACGDLD